MKERILTNWTVARVLYLVIGITVIIQAIMIQQWLGVVFGGYFASMGLFAFGCASGNCFGGNPGTEPNQKSTASIPDVEYEEVKSK